MTPNLDSAGRFKEFLMGIQKERPDVMGKVLVAKIVHDKLNKRSSGLPVQNDAGDEWNLTGDGTLNTKNLALIRKAVSRSIYNVAVEAVNGVRAEAMFHHVWQYTPNPNSASTKVISKLITTYTTPTNNELIKAAAKLIQDNYQILLDEAIASGGLKPE